MAPLLRLLPGNLFELMEPVSASVGPIKIEVPAGFVTDLASIPSVLHWWIRPTDSRAATAAIVHDWLYLTHSVPRAVADALFLSLLRADGMPRIRAKALIVGVII